MTRKCISKKINSRKVIFALVDNANGSFTVLKLCENYCGQIRGGIRKTWRAVVANATEQEARKIFDRRVSA